jgi:hypothetical protein
MQQIAITAKQDRCLSILSPDRNHQSGSSGQTAAALLAAANDSQSRPPAGPTVPGSEKPEGAPCALGLALKQIAAMMPAMKVIGCCFPAFSLFWSLPSLVRAGCVLVFIGN